MGGHAERQLDLGGARRPLRRAAGPEPGLRRRGVPRQPAGRRPAGRAEGRPHGRRGDGGHGPEGIRGAAAHRPPAHHSGHRVHHDGRPSVARPRLLRRHGARLRSAPGPRAPALGGLGAPALRAAAAGRGVPPPPEVRAPRRQARERPGLLRPHVRQASRLQHSPICRGWRGAHDDRHHVVLGARGPAGRLPVTGGGCLGLGLVLALHGCRQPPSGSGQAREGRDGGAQDVQPVAPELPGSALERRLRHL
mmetsp:Transcript_85312/g.244994  ORF Transcript_85312/g.244994 Transcript_85312/m.244994 type:complete len:250 (+) Transcript_85312:481-1230(+)